MDFAKFRFTEAMVTILPDLNGQSSDAKSPIDACGSTVCRSQHAADLVQMRDFFDTDINTDTLTDLQQKDRQ